MRRDWQQDRKEDGRIEMFNIGERRFSVDEIIMVVGLEGMTGGCNLVFFGFLLVLRVG